MKLKAKIIAIIVAVLVVAGIVTLSVTLGKNCGGSSETVSASEQASESIAKSESEAASEKESEANSEAESETNSEKEPESETDSDSAADSDSAEHTHSGGEATCTKKAVCSVCGEEYGELKAHDFSVKTADEKYLVKAAGCENAATYYVSCSVCGEKGEETFEDGEALGHKPADAVIENVVGATCTSAGSCDSVVKCSVCDKVLSRDRKTTTPALGHNGGRYVSNGNGGHYNSCTRCGTKMATTACSGGTATCKELATCSTCGGKYGTLAAHSYTKEVAEAKYLASKATCESAAKYYKLCEYCGEKGNETFESAEEKDKALGHEMSDGVVSLGDDTHAKKCMRSGCGYVEGEPEACSGGTATCTEKAVCDKCKKEYGAEPSHSWNDGEEITPVTCLVDGVKKYTCTVEGCGETKTETIKCVGYHTYDPNAKIDCTVGRECTTCHEIEETKPHNFGETVKDPDAVVDCTHGATGTQTCSECGYTKKVTSDDDPALEPALGHTPKVNPEKDVLLKGNDYCYIKGYTCLTCGEDITEEKSEIIRSHEYVASIITPATCMTAGEKKLTCTKCGFETTEEIEIDTVNGHNWDEGTLVEGTNRKELKCLNEGCNETKTVVVVASVEGTVSAGDVKENGEVHLDGASMDLSDIKDQLPEDGEVTIGAKTLTEEKKNELLSAADKETIGENEVYDFTLANADGSIDFGGKTVKIVLPYNLKPGDDVDSIAIWYIDDEGKTTNVKAFYYEVGGKGYVTFEAEHFSYYTVTRLTPAERCALYGHSEREYKIAETCTDEGYTLYVCLRCGEERKEDKISARGHDYEETKTDATCVADGKIVYKCSVCDYSYEEVIVAAGHQWDVTKTEATCETAGYTEKTCTKCGDSFKENYVQAYGHDYVATWVWNGYTSATLKMTCSHDDSHVVEITATITEVREEATCLSPERIVYTAKASFDGRLYSDEKEEIKGDTKLEHKFDEAYSYDEEAHYKECILCGSREEVSDHEFGEGEIIKSATCSAYGEKVYVCETCGYVRKDIIPATGEHLYINNVCAYCGAVYAACDHTVLTPKLLTGEDLGICKGTQIVVMTCACGEVKKWVDEGAIACEIEQLTESGVTEDGNDYYKLVDTCKICGASFDFYYEEAETKCGYIQNGYLKITKNGVVKLNAELEDVNNYMHSNTETQKINISDLTTETVCGGYITVEKCLDCGKILRLHVKNSACTEILDQDFTEYEYVDKGGIVRNGVYVECKVCGLKYCNEVAYVMLNNCVYYGVNSYKVILGEKVVYDCVIRDGVGGDHETERTYEKLGETCEDGVKVTTTCKNCDLVHTWISYSHQTEYEELELPEGSCGGRIDVQRCVVCNEIVRIQYVSGNHSYSYTKKTYTDDNNIEHTVTTESCSRCGYEYVTDEYRVLRGENPCEWAVYRTKTISYDGEVICTADETSYTDTHDYERTARLKEGASSCEDGIIITETCKICNESYEWERTGHYYEWIYVDFPEEACDGYLSVYQCLVCGDISDYDKGWNDHQYETEVDETYTGDDGYEHRSYLARCTKCGFEYGYDEYKVPGSDNQCEYTLYRTTTYKISDWSKSFEERYDIDSHIFVYEFELNGETCEDGWTANGKCKICDKETIESGSWHNSLTVDYYDLAEKGACEGTYIRKYQCACGYNERIDYNFCDGVNRETVDLPLGDGEYSHTRTTYTCNKCNLKVEIEKIGVKEINVEEHTCNIVYTANWNIAVGGTGIANIPVKSVDTYNHNFERKYTLKEGSSTCYDGVIVNEVCLDCGYTDNYESRGHSYNVVESHELNSACGGTAYYKECPCGYYKTVEYSCKCDFDQHGYSGDVEGVVKDGSYSYFDGYYYSDNLDFYIDNHYSRFWNEWSIYTCAVTDPVKCGYVIRYSEYWAKTDNCTATRYERWQFGYNEDTGDCDWEKIIDTKEVRVYHEFEREEINENGVSGYKLTCACGSYYTYREFFDENGNTVRIEVESENLAENGGIKKHIHTVDVTNWNRDLGFVTCTYTDADGEEHTSTCERTAYDTEDGFTDGVKYVFKSENYSREYIYAYHELKNGDGCRLDLYEKRTENEGTENEYWREWKYKYDFDACKRFEYYTNSNNETNTEEYSHFGVISDRIEKEPTCTQPGERVSYCVNCEEILNRYEIEPDHAWAKVGDDRYVCVVCGLENTNGASGKIVMEDLTDYENGEDYVVGYYFRDGDISSYVLSVSLVRKTASGNEYDEIYLDMTDFVITTDGTVSVRFSKAIAEQLALAKLGELSLNRDDYNIRFSFVPKGFKDELDYAITFENVDYSAPTETDGNAEYIIRTDDLQNGVEFSFTPTENCSLAILAPSLYIRGKNHWGNVWFDFSTSVLEGQNDVYSVYNLCGGNEYGYAFTYKLEGGKAYKITIGISYIDSSSVKFIPVTFISGEQLAEKYGHTLNGEKIDANAIKEFETEEEFLASGCYYSYDRDDAPSACGGTFRAYFRCEDCKSEVCVLVHIKQLHVYSYTTTLQPTCETDGLKKGVCICGKTENEVVIPALGHEYVWELRDSSESGDGKEHLIGVCGRVYLSDSGYYESCREGEYTIDVSEESFSKEVISEPTCGEGGQIKFTMVIGDGKTMEVYFYTSPVGNHTLNGVEVNEDETFVFANEDEVYASGLKLFGNVYLSNCGDVASGYCTCDVCHCLIAVSIKLEHYYGVVTSSEDPTCERDGSRVVECVCGKNSHTEQIKALGHDYRWTAVDAADSDDGKYRLIGICCREFIGESGEYEACHEGKYRIEYVSDKPFTVDVVSEPTCAEGQLNYEVVDDNGDIIVIKVFVPAVREHHTLNGEFIDVNEPLSIETPGVKLFGNSNYTCAEDCRGYFVCDVCDHVISVLVKVPHRRPDKIEDGNYQVPTCVTPGWIRYNCTVCATADVYEVLEPMGHDYKAEVIDKADSDDGKYHLVYICQRERENEEGVLAPCAEEGCRIDYVSDEPIIVEVIMATCCENGKKRYTINCEDGSTQTFIELIPRTGIHDFNGMKIDPNVVMVFATVEAFKNSGLKLMGNSNELSCGNVSHAYFCCENSKEIIAVNVRLAHTPDESGVKETEDGHRHYTCDVCKDEIDEIIENRESAN